MGAPGPLRAASGGARGPNNQTKVTATLRPAVPRVLRLRAGGRWTTRPQNTTDSCAENLCRDRRVFRNHCKTHGFITFWHPQGSKTVGKRWSLCFLCAAASPTKAAKRPPEGHTHKTLVNSDRIWGVFLSSFSCSLRFFFRGSEFLFGAVVAAPSVPQGCLGGPFGVLCARPGAPRRGHRTVVIRCFWGLTGVLWGARWGLARFLRFLLADFLDKLEVGLRSCTARVCLCRLPETLVFYEVLGGVRVWRAGRGAGLRGSRGLSWGAFGPSGGLWLGSLGASGNLWGPLGASGWLAGSPKRDPKGGAGGVSGGLWGPIFKCYRFFITKK